MLVTSGWLSEAEARDPRARVDAASSSHTVSRVVAADGRSVVVKQVPRAAAAAGRSLRQELFVYRLANWIPEVAEAVPRAILIDEKHQVLVVESMDGGGAWPNPEASPPVGSPGLVERLGALMAGWHRATQDTGLWVSPAIGILDMPEALDIASQGRPLATQRLMRGIAEDADFSTCLRTARRAWLDRCLIHGDIRRENWTVSGGVSGTREAGPVPRSGQVKVLDWELSGSGDPAWDLGSVVAEVMLETIREQRGDGWSADQEATLRLFFQNYVSHGGLVVPRDADQWNHVIGCAVARLLHVACEWADAQAETDTGPVPLVLAQARLLLQRRSELIETYTAMPWA